MAAIDRIEGLRLARQGLPLTARQAAALIGCSKSWLHKQVMRGEIKPAGHRGIKVMFSSETVLLIARRAGIPTGESVDSEETGDTVS